MSLSSQLKSLTRLRCSIFQTTYNPKSLRTGAKYLRARLQGPAMVAYYPEREEHSITQLNKLHPGWNMVDVDEVIRLNDVKDRQKRGKGVPKKTKKNCEFLLFCVLLLRDRMSDYVGESRGGTSCTEETMMVSVSVSRHTHSILKHCKLNYLAKGLHVERAPIFTIICYTHNLITLK